MLTKEQNEMICHVDKGTPMGEVFRRFWLPALLSKELPMPDCPPVRVKLLGEELVAFRDSEGRVGIVDSLCAHRCAPLFFGRNEEGGLRCIYHGWKFDVHGNCMDMPSEPEESNLKKKVKLKSYPTIEQGDLIWIYMGPADKQPADIPQLEWACVPENHRVAGKFLMECNYLQALEGDFDPSHVAFLHSTLDHKMDDPTSYMSSQKLLSSYNAKKSFKYFARQKEYGLLSAVRRPSSEDSYFWRLTQWLLPTFALIPNEKGHFYNCNVRIPIDNENCWHFRVIWHPDRPLTKEERYAQENVVPLTPGTFQGKATKENDYCIDRYWQKSYSFSGIKDFPTQDRAMAEGMGGIVDRSREHLGASDTAVIQIRRRLLRMAEDLMNGVEPIAPHQSDLYNIRAVSKELPRDVDMEEGAKEEMAARWPQNTAGKV